MSVELLQRVKAHIEPLLTGYQIRYFRWTDADLLNKGQVVLFRMAGTGGSSDHLVQYPDVSVQVLCDEDKVAQGSALVLSIMRYLRSEEGFSSGPVENYEPLQNTGPSYLNNGRARFELVIRCMVEDH